MSEEYQKLMKENQKKQNSFGFIGGGLVEKVVEEPEEKKPTKISEFNLATSSLNCTKKF